MLSPVSAFSNPPSSAVRFYCKTEYLPCPEECKQFIGKPRWFFDLTSGGSENYYQEWYVDADSGSVYVDGYRKSGTIKVATSYISFSQEVDGAILERTEISRVDGRITIEEIHTDGSIKDIPIGQPYGKYIGYCKKDIVREF